MSRSADLDPDRWEQVEKIFFAALEHPEPQRGDFVDAACGSDLELRREVTSLLRAHDRGPIPPGSTTGQDTREPVDVERVSAALAGRYTIGSELGVGGMATVYRARDERHGRDVAIKVLHPLFAAALGRERFLREIRIAATLRHPHILPLFDSGDAGGLLYYVMPVEAESLRHRLERAPPLTLDQSLRLTCEILDALDYAHGEGVIHRDIKPENILLSRGHAIVADFGIARAMSAAGDTTMTQAGWRLGTPAYMSPEQLVGDPSVDGRTDIYSVACVLLEMLAGTAATPGRPTELLEAAGGPVPEHVARAVRTAVAGSPDDRFATCADFGRALVLPGAGLAQARFQDQPSIAVLPFANLSPDPENEYFSDGITEEIINALTQVRGLRVAARTSCFVFKGSTEDVTRVGAKLKVATILEGSVRKAGNRMRITAQLVDAGSGYHLWSERYDREFDDVFSIQDEISRAIVNRLKVTLSDTADPRLVKPPTRDLEAYRLYLKGRHLWSRRSREGLERAVDYFGRAIERDPEYALAYAGLADAYLLLGSYGIMPRGESRSRAKEAVERALELDDSLAEAHASRGQILRAERDWAGEEREYLRAIELNPGYATAYQWYSTLLAALGRSDEALRMIRRAEELDPLSHAISVTVAEVLYFHGDEEGAIAQLHRAVELEPNFASAHAWLSIVYASVDRFDEAIASARTAAELSPDNPNVVSGMAFAYARMGERERALEIIEQAIERGARAWPGMIMAILGDVDAAFDQLEEAQGSEESWDGLFYARVLPWMDLLRSDPRYQRLVQKLQFPE